MAGSPTPGKLHSYHMILCISRLPFSLGWMGRRAGGGWDLSDKGPPLWGWGRLSHDAVGEVLEAVVEFGGDGAHAPVHHLLHQ